MKASNSHLFNEKKRVLVTGGAGFIGSNLVRFLLQNTEWQVYNIDKLTYAGNLLSLADVESNPRYQFAQVELNNANELGSVFKSFKPNYIMHLAAESHVDRSIDGPRMFIDSNINGTFTLLETARAFYSELDDSEKTDFRFLHVSTDEVFGSLGPDGFFDESTPYDPRSPYSASKAASDHLVRSWYHTFGLPVMVSNCSNNYGPFQFPEKLIPVVILNAIAEKDIPVYGKGENIRDWLYVVDHVKALTSIITHGVPGETYCIGGKNEVKNLDLVTRICDVLDQLKPSKNLKSYRDLIKFVDDRPGHDKRYAINPQKIMQELAWEPLTNISEGMQQTVQWYLDNNDWCRAVMKNKYDLQRLGRL